MATQGILISFEGMEGAGKTTQCDLLEALFSKQRRSTTVVREPGGVPIAEQIRDVVLSPKNAAIATSTEVLLFQAARAQLYHEVVLPALKRGGVVLMDRTRDSSLVYQGMVRGVGVETIERLNDYSTATTLPNVTFLLDLPPKVGLDRRRAAGELDRIEQEGLKLQKKVCKAYMEVAKADSSGRWVVIDGLVGVDEVHAAVVAELESRGYLREISR